MSEPGATIRAMPGDLERMPARVLSAAPGAGPAAVAGELLGRVRAELPAVGELGEREQVLVAAWLTGLRSARTRRAYATDVVAWFGWLARRDTDALAAGRVHVGLWAATQLDAGAAASSVRRRLSALSSFYRYCAAHDLIARVPTQGVARPVVDPDYTATVGLDRDQARALVAAADADTGAQALRTAAVVRLLLHNALRVDEACAADVANLGEDSGHRVLRVVRKGARRAKIPLTPATVAALEAYLADRAQRAGAASWLGRCWPPPLADGSARATCGNWCAAWPAWPGSARGISSHRTACAIRRSPSPWTPAPPCATCRTTPATKIPAPPVAMTTLVTAWTATRPTPSPPTWRDSIGEQLGDLFVGASSSASITSVPTVEQRLQDREGSAAAVGGGRTQPSRSVLGKTPTRQGSVHPAIPGIGSDLISAGPGLA
jgi:integrase/recombinase XerD